MREIVEPRRARTRGESNPPASSMKLEARTPVLALRETAAEHATDGDPQLAEGTGRERVVRAP